MPLAACRLPLAACRLPLALSVLLSISLTYAQSSNAQPESPEDPGSQVPTDKEAAAEAAEFLAKNVPAGSLPAGSPRLDAMRERAANVQKQHSQYLQDIASGKTLPHAHLHEIRPQLENDLKALSLSLDQISAETDPAKKEILSKAFFAALQPLGPHLETADPGEGHTNLLSAQQEAALTRLEQAWDEADKDYDTTSAPLQILGPGLLYTITRLSVPVAVQAPPSSKVIFQTFGGGLFPNKLALIEVEADATGIARTEWVSYGDSFADTVIGARSAAAPPAENLTITTVQLSLTALPELPPITPPGQ